MHKHTRHSHSHSNLIHFSFIYMCASAVVFATAAQIGKKHISNGFVVRCAFSDQIQQTIVNAKADSLMIWAICIACIEKSPNIYLHFIECNQIAIQSF